MRGSNCKQLNHGIAMNWTRGLALLHIRILSAHHCQQFPGFLEIARRLCIWMLPWGCLGRACDGSAAAFRARKPGDPCSLGLRSQWGQPGTQLKSATVSQLRSCFYRLNVLGFQVEGTNIWPSIPQKRHWCTSYWVTWNQTTLRGFPG